MCNVGPIYYGPPPNSRTAVLIVPFGGTYRSRLQVLYFVLQFGATAVLKG